MADLLVPVQEVATFLRMSVSDPDREGDLLLEVVESAHEQVESKVGPLGSDSIELVVHQPGPVLVLPIKNLTSVVSVVDAQGREVPSDGITPNLRAGLVTIESSGRAPWTVTVAAAERAASVRQAIKIVAAHLWETQRGRAGGGARNSVYTAAGDPTNTAPIAQGFAFPRRAEQLLAPYALLGV